MKILIANNNMNIGGIQKALLNLLNEFSSRYEITLFLFSPTGPLMSEIPSNVNVISGNLFTRVLGITNAEARSNGMFTYLFRGFFTVLTRVFGTKLSFGILTRMQSLKQNYDVAISYMQNGDEHVFYGGCNEFVINSVKAKKKASFVHCDFLNYEGNNPYNKHFYKRYDYIAGCSMSVCDRFIQATNIPSDNVVCVHNCYNVEQILALSDEYNADYSDGVYNLFSASRLSEEKGITRTVKILARLKDDGFKFVWRIAGDGPQMEEVKALIAEYKLDKNIVLLGMLKNPYPYIKSADALLVPSYNEAAPMVFGEAELLGTYVITTNTTSAHELVSERGIGVVCGVSDDDIYKCLSQQLAQRKVEFGSVTKNDFNNQAVEEFIRLIG